MTPPTTEELLRLARQWAKTDQLELDEDECRIGIYVCGEPLLEIHTVCSSRRSAIHAALLVLSGELDASDIAELAAWKERLSRTRPKTLEP